MTTPQPARQSNSAMVNILIGIVVVVLSVMAAYQKHISQIEQFSPTDFVELDKYVWTSHEFISQSEILHILNMIKENGGWEASPTGDNDWLVPTNINKLSDKFNKDLVIKNIELRVANWTGITPHLHEDMLSIARILPKKNGNLIRGGNYFPYGLHHETDTRPHRTKTIIMYMVQPEAGGRTAFPLLGKQSPDSQNLLSDISSQLNGFEKGYSRHVSFDPKLDHPYNTHFEKTCKGTAGISIVPSSGSALLFSSAFGLNPQGSEYIYNQHAWHCGCNVQEGEKIIMTKFKETPMRERPTHSSKMNNKQYRPWVPVEGL